MFIKVACWSISSCGSKMSSNSPYQYRNMYVEAVYFLPRPQRASALYGGSCFNERDADYLELCAKLVATISDWVVSQTLVSQTVSQTLVYQLAFVLKHAIWCLIRHNLYVSLRIFLECLFLLFPFAIVPLSLSVSLSPLIVLFACVDTPDLYTYDATCYCRIDQTLLVFIRF